MVFPEPGRPQRRRTICGLGGIKRALVKREILAWKWKYRAYGSSERVVDMLTSKDEESKRRREGVHSRKPREGLFRLGRVKTETTRPGKETYLGDGSPPPSPPRPQASETFSLWMLLSPLIPAV